VLWNNDPHCRVVTARCNLAGMPKPELLESFANPYPDRDYVIQMTCAEFTSLCPVGGIESDAAELELLKGGAPDFGTITIVYAPAAACVELKSLKLYLWSYRNDGVFYERAVNQILDDVSGLVRPKWMQVVGDYNVRGGIKSVITASRGTRPPNA
jgi:7-cyano-7-deazaguanine reductase